MAIRGFGGIVPQGGFKGPRQAENASMCSQTSSSSLPEPRLKHLRSVALRPLPKIPLVSVLVTNYNYGKYIGEAIQSVLKQTYPNVEVIICDDGSTDNSRAVIEAWCKKDPRIRLVCQANSGQGSAMNAAFSIANGEVIALLDGDDAAHERRLELVVQAFQQHPDAGMVTHALRIVDAVGECGGRDPEEPLDEGWLAPALLGGPEPVFPPTSGLALRMDIAKRLFPLPWERIPGAHWDWIVREGAAFLAPVVALDEVVGTYRLHGHSLFGHSRLITVEHIERRLAGLAGAMEGRRIYARTFLNTEPNQAECDVVLGALILSRAVLKGERVSRSQIARYSLGKSRWIWSFLFLLPSWLRKRIYIWGRETQIPWKGRRIKGQVFRILKDFAGTFGIRWRPGRRVR
jgi:glycosyltransferase involved in cell wall biosynthesis